MFTRRPYGLVVAASLTAAALPASAQSDTVSINLSGIVLQNPFPNVSRNSTSNATPGSATAITLADGYSFSIDGQIDVNVFGADFYPPGPGTGPLGGLLDFIEPGQSRLLNGFVRNPGGIPAGGRVVWTERFDGDFNGLTLGITLRFEISGTGVVTTSVRDIQVPFLFRPFFTINFVSGAAVLSTWEPSTPELTEWHLDGDLLADPRGDDAQMRYLDDPAFGPILGGLGSEDVYPNPPTPLGVTDAQSMFVDTATSPVSAPGGIEDTVLLTSPAFNVSDPGNSALRRGLGLSVFPSVQPEYPAGFIGAWTMIWDLNIPSSSWFTSPGVRRTDLLALLQDNHNNEDGADLWIRSQNGATQIVYAPEGENFNDTPLTLPANAVAPDTWFRLAVASDEFQRGRSRVYVNGAFIGEILSDWVFNGVDPQAPAFGDGEPVDPADWAAWGEFPAPFARSSNAEAPATLSSTFNLFSDLRFGGSQPAYLANFAFTDELLTDAEIAALGGPSGDGIVYLKSDVGGCNLADFSEEFGSLDINDILTFADAFDAEDASADVTGEGDIDINDILTFADAFDAGCP